MELFELIARRHEATEQQLLFADSINAAERAHQQGRPEEALSLLQAIQPGLGEPIYLKQLISKYSESLPVSG
jgi:hypothetical protein